MRNNICYTKFAFILIRKNNSGIKITKKLIFIINCNFSELFLLSECILCTKSIVKLKKFDYVILTY